MVDAAAVAEGDGGDQLLEVSPGGSFSEPASGDLVEKLSASDVLHHDVDLCLSGHDLEEVDSVRVANAAEDGDLSFYMTGHSAFHDLLLVDDFDGYVLAGVNVPG